MDWARETLQPISLRHSDSAVGSVAQAIAGRECRRWGGYALESSADMFFAVFTGAADALACALAFRSALEAQPVANGVENSPARMALHVGELETEEDLACHPAWMQARCLLCAAHGGQTLGTNPLQALLGNHAHSNLCWKDLGEYRLAEGQRPERIFQIETADQPEHDFPALRAARLQTDTLPLPLDRFFGRETELTRLTELLGTPDTRLITLTGMGGAGKTRLAIEVGHRVQAEFPGLVWFVPLAILEDASGVPAALCRTLNVPSHLQNDSFTQVCDFLNRQQSPTLLILDNFDPFIEEGAEWVHRLLTNVRSLTCLLTSRQSLELPGEQEWPVLPLPVPAKDEGGRMKDELDSDSSFITHPSSLACASVQLFVSRAQAVKPDFQMTPGNRDCIAQICIALEGIPLAIELATARAQVMTPHEMLDALQQRFDFLTTQRRSILPRHRALRATIDWSFERLRPELQTFFARLSVFRDGWTAQTASEMCETRDAREWLRELRARSFILETIKSGMSEMRFAMLETLREYGAEKLTSEEEKGTRSRHLACFLKVAETASEHLYGPDQGQWLERLEAEYANVRAALAWSLSTPEEAESALRMAGAFWSFFQVRGYIREGRSFVQAALAQGSKLPTPVRAQALNGAGALAQMQGDYTDARASYAQSLEIWQLLKQEKGIASALNNLGLIAELQGDFQEAQRLYEQGLGIREKIKDKQGLAASYNNLGILMQMRRDYAQAREWYLRSLALKRELQQWQGAAATLNNLGNVAHALRDYNASRAYHEESLAIRQRLGEKQGIAGSLNNLGMVAEARGEYEEAQGLYERSLAIKQKLGDRQGVGMTLHNLGTLARLQGNLISADTYCRQSLRLHHEIGDRHGMTGGLQALAIIADAQGHSNRSARLYAACAALCSALGMTISNEEKVEQQQITATLSAKLGTEVLAQEQAVGSALTLEEAVAYALEVSPIV